MVLCLGKLAGQENNGQKALLYLLLSIIPTKLAFLLSWEDLEKLNKHYLVIQACLQENRNLY